MAGMTAARLEEITVYPVKSAGGISAPEWGVGARGLTHDRRWMVVTPDGEFLTQREWPRLALVAPTVESEALRLDAPGRGSVRVPLTPQGGPVTVRVWKSVCEAIQVGPEADGWLSDFLGTPCRLVFMPDTTRRAVSPQHSAGEGIVSFADGYPLLLIGDGSLADLNRRLDAPVPMSRFRPNLVVSGLAPYAEDGWARVRIGGVRFHAVKPCGRCSLTTIDQGTGERRGPEPLQTLASYRRRDGKVLFGQYLIPAAPGVVRVGDAVVADLAAAEEAR